MPSFEPAVCPSGADRALPPLPPEFAGARCGYLVVPENRLRPDGRTIRLAVAILPARSSTPAPDPVVFLAGGPGALAFWEAGAIVAAGLNREHDAIFVQQRGTLLSDPALTCPVLDRFQARLVGLRYGVASTRRKHVVATRACRRQLVARGVDLAAYNTRENAADFVDLRRALGLRSYNLYGLSYGTDLALTLMRDHPEGIRSVVLDSTLPPQDFRHADYWPEARDGFRNLFAACAAQPRCQARFPNLEATFARLVRRLEARPIRTVVRDPQTRKPTTVVLDGGKLVNWLVSMSAAPPADVVRVPARIYELAHGQPRDIAEAVAAVPPAGLRGYGLFYGVTCSEAAPFSGQRAVLQAGRRAFPGYPDSVLAQPPQEPFIFDDCKVWDVPPDRQARRPTHSDIPTLLLSGTFDAITAGPWAKSAAETLTNARLVRVPGAGHFVLPFSGCVQTVARSFLDRPQSPRTACVAQQRVPPFLTNPRPNT